GRQRIRPVDAGPIPAKEIAGLPEIERKEGTDDCRTGRRAGLQRADAQRGEPDCRTRKNYDAKPVDQRIASALELRGAIRPSDAPMQFPDERRIGTVKPLLLH